MKYDWIHPEDFSDQWDGYNEPGLEHFIGSPLRNLAREVVQNSLDAHSSSCEDPTIVAFDLIDISCSDIPSIDTLEKNLELCLSAAENEGPKAKSFFEQATRLISRKSLRALVVSDYNTLGIAGPPTNGHPYYAFMKAKGQSKKLSDTASGSFGIGKFAPFTVSKLRTVFVSTVFSDGEGRPTQYSQGKSILMSHDDEDQRRHQGVGFWGVIDKCMPVEGDGDTIPTWLSRTKAENAPTLGTRLVILGVDLDNDWKSKLATAIAENFFGAIHDRKLEVQIDGSLSLCAGNLMEFFSTGSSGKRGENESEHFNNCRTYFETLSSDKVRDFHIQHRVLGLCQLRIIVQEGLSKRVCFLRNGMFISDELRQPGLKRLNEFKDFVAVFQCLDPSGSKLLRQMEPPKHDDFEPERLQTELEQKKAKSALKDIAKWIREKLGEVAKDPVSDVTIIDELRDFFPDELGDGDGDLQFEINPNANVSIQMLPSRRTSPTRFGTEPSDPGFGDSENDATEGGGGGDTGSGGGDGIGGAGPLPGGSGRGSGERKKVELQNPRIIVQESERVKLAFTPTKTAKIALEIAESGADAEYPLSVLGADLGEVLDGILVLECQSGQRVAVEMQVPASVNGALKVIAHEV